LDSKLPRILGLYGPPMDQVPPAGAVGSPVKAIAMTERAAANCSPKP
jgi:hypothetical protein